MIFFETVWHSPSNITFSTPPSCFPPNSFAIFFLLMPDRKKNVNDMFSFVHEHENCINVRGTGFVQTAISSCS